MHLSSASHQMLILSCLLLLLSAFTSGVSDFKHDRKLPICCKTLTKEEPRIKMTRCFILSETRKCLESVVFLDIRNKLHCIDPTAPWLSERMKRLEMHGLKCLTKP